ncbi:NADP-dependent oxidoreductase [Novosphingobium lentum]|uniref:NADP-dependent oxidoreductase n=1 Tax=Novosphingobium lentum TaxID=145287 RepID=UPI00082E191B|nr:NADP-dependent oxidoreductase [Novosphingobium lentum]
MRIVRAHEFGGVDKLVLDTIDAPAPGPGQVRIAVRAMGVNPVDWKLLSGKAPVLPPLPLVPGGDVAGVVDAVGEGVTGFARGDRVFAHPGLTGGYAESIVLVDDIVAPIGGDITCPQAAAIPLVALTAWQAFAADGRDLSGLKVLVHNAAGGVGSVAVQIAKARGAHVIGSASDANAEFVRGLGADEVVDFRNTSPGSMARDMDVLLDLVGNSLESGLWALVREGGSVLRVAGGATAPAEEVVDGVRSYKVRVRPNGAQLRELSAMMDRGELRADIAATFPLAAATDALRLSMVGHTRGKIVLTAD